MNESTNPYQSPGKTTSVKNVWGDGFRDKQKIAVWSFVLSLALLTAVDFAVFEMGVFILAPFVLFFVSTIWATVSATRHSGSHIAVRVATGVVIGVFVTPAAVFFLVVTCGPATAMVGAGWDIHGRFKINVFEAIAAFAITFVLTAFFAGIIFFLADRVLRNIGSA